MELPCMEEEQKSIWWNIAQLVLIVKGLRILEGHVIAGLDKRTETSITNDERDGKTFDRPKRKANGRNKVCPRYNYYYFYHYYYYYYS